MSRAPPPAFAHITEGPIGGFADGFAHPLTGLDHFLAMFAVGVWGAQMPGGMTGRNVAAGAKARRPTLKTLFSSGYTENSIIHQGKLDPGVNFLPKPFRRQKLALKVRTVLDAYVVFGVGDADTDPQPAGGAARCCFAAAAAERCVWHRGRIALELAAMAGESTLKEKLRKIEALFAGAATAGERAAAGAAADRIRARLRESEGRERAVEVRFSLPDQWSRRLFIALCRRYGLRPFRYPRMHRQSVVVKVPRSFLDQVLWPEFAEINAALSDYLAGITDEVIRAEVYKEAGEAEEMAEPARLGRSA